MEINSKNLRSICKKYDLKLSPNEKWQNIEICPGYFSDFYKIADNIVYSTGRPNSKYFMAEPFFNTLTRFVEDENINLPIILIRDLTKIDGMPRSEERQKQGNYLLENKEKFTGLIYCTTKEIFKILLKLAALNYGKSLPLLVVPSADQAINNSIKILKSGIMDKKDNNNSISYDSLIFRPEWEYSNKSTNYSYKCGIISIYFC